MTETDKVAFAVCPACEGREGRSTGDSVYDRSAEWIPCHACIDHPGYLFGEEIRGPCFHFDYGVEGKPFNAEDFDPPWRFDDSDYGDNYPEEYESCNCHGTGLVARITVASLVVGTQFCIQVQPYKSGTEAYEALVTAGSEADPRTDSSDWHAGYGSDPDAAACAAVAAYVGTLTTDGVTA